MIILASFTLDAQEAKEVICAACHGPKGNSINPQWPNIAGQYPQYFIKQLKDMRNKGLRNVPEMNALVATLSEQEMIEWASYYYKMPLAHAKTPEKFFKRGEQLYRVGDYTKHIPPCIACHGPKGEGNAQAGFPVLSGQNAAYTLAQLHAFKNGKRTNDLNHIMHDMSRRMSDEDMEAVAYYISGLH